MSRGVVFLLLSSLGTTPLTNDAAGRSDEVILLCTTRGEVTVSRDFKVTQSTPIERSVYYRFANGGLSWTSPGEDDWSEPVTHDVVMNANVLKYSWAREWDDRMNDHGLTFERREIGSVVINRIAGTIAYDRQKTVAAVKFVVDGQVSQRVVQTGNGLDEKRSGACATATNPFAGKARKF